MTLHAPCRRQVWLLVALVVAAVTMPGPATAQTGRPPGASPFSPEFMEWAERTRTAGTSAGPAAAAITADVTRALLPCWQAAVRGLNVGTRRLTLTVAIGLGGTIDTVSIIDNDGDVIDAGYIALARAATTAARDMRCQPLPLPVDGSGRTIRLTFITY